MKRYLIVMSALLAFAHCKKDNVADTTSPSVTITAPVDGAHFPAGLEITVTAKVIDDHELEEVHFHVTNKTTSEEIIHEHYHPGGSSYDFTGHVTVQAGITYHIEVEAEDKAGNATEAEVDVVGQ